MHTSYRQVFVQAPLRDLGRANVHVYLERDEFDDRLRAEPTLPYNPVIRGFFTTRNYQLVSYRGDDLLALYSVLSHEGFHQFSYAHLVPEGAEKVMPWFEEGLAEYFRSSARRDDHLIRDEQLHHRQRVRQALEQDRAWTLQRLWDTEPLDLRASEDIQDFYAYAHQFVSYVFDREQWIVWETFQRKRQGQDNAEIMQAIFEDMDLDRLQRDFEAWVRA